jgi:pyruvate,water dikinase
MDQFEEGDVLLTDMTDPDWEPIMKKSSAIITNRGGRTCHAAIIARELGVPAVVGCGDATELVADGSEVTVSCSEGDEGHIYAGLLDFDYNVRQVNEMPEIPVKVMMNVGNPDRAFTFAQLPNDGVGLARLEFIINNMVGIHPKALINADKMADDVQKIIYEKTTAYGDPVEFYVSRIVEGVSTIAASFSPKKVIVRLSDFKSNEYANLIGGAEFEPHEENPMLGWRGASRYYSEGYSEGFELECRALKKVRETIGLDNVIVMIPFCRTLGEAKKVLQIMEESGLKRGVNGLKVYMMCEIPSNYILATQFAKYFDGFSIGSNDLTQLILGVDRDSAKMAHLFDESNLAVKTAIREVIERAHKAGIEIGFCGQAPSDNADYAKFLVECGIDSISVVPDSVIGVIRKVTEAEAEANLAVF